LGSCSSVPAFRRNSAHTALYAQLARRLADDGIVTLRFDLGGIGDSRQEYEQRPLKERTELEVRAAVDYLTELFCLDGIVLGGLCSGAEDAVRGAWSDSRVSGVVLIDPFAYRTAGWAWRHALHRAARRVLRALGYYAPPVVRKASGGPGQGKHPRLVTYKYMERSESTLILSGLVARNVRIHFLYTAGMRDFFNHERQLHAMFGDLGNLATVDYFPGIDHTQALEEDRRALVECIARRLRERKPS